MNDMLHSNGHSISIQPFEEGYMGYLYHGHVCLFRASGGTEMDCYNQIAYYLVNKVGIYNDLMRQITHLNDEA